MKNNLEKGGLDEVRATETAQENSAQKSKKTIDREKRTQILRVLKFVVFSASAGVIQLVTFTLMNEVGKLPYWPSYLTALVLSVLFNFTVNRKFTFKAANNVPIAMLKVAAYYAVFTPLSTLWGNALTGQAGWNEYLVLVLTMAVNLSTEYLYQRFVVYRNSVDSDAKSQTAAYKAVTELPVENGYLSVADKTHCGACVYRRASAKYGENVVVGFQSEDGQSFSYKVSAAEHIAQIYCVYTAPNIAKQADGVVLISADDKVPADVTVVDFVDKKAVKAAKD